MLILWRRHTKKCPHDSRESQKCICPIWIDWTTEGKRIRKPLNLRDWQAAQQRARQIEADGLGANKSVNTIDNAMDQFEVHLTKQRNVREPTLRKYKFLFKRLREFCQSRGLIFLNQLSVEEASNFRNTWTIGPLTHVKQLERLKAFFRFCVEMEWIKSSPVKSFKPPKVNEQEIVPFTEDEVRKVLKACDSFKGTNRKSLKALTHLMLASGLRIGDAVMLSKKSIAKDRQGYSLALRTEKTGLLSPANCLMMWPATSWRSGMGITRSGQAIATPRTARRTGESPFLSCSNRPACPAIRINSGIPLRKGCLSRECRLERLQFF